MDPSQQRVARFGELSRPLMPVAVGLLSMMIATLLIVRTYSVFYQTFDESAHIACGMEWLDHGTYYYEALHPPLARTATAILPYLDGSRYIGLKYTGPDTMWAEGNAILDGKGNYERTLTLARLGILPFFWFAGFLVWRFMSKRFAAWHAAIAVLFLAFCPVVLGQSGLATTDTPLMAMFLWSLTSLYALLENPRWPTASLAAVAIALAILTKFTEIPFLCVGGGALFLYFWIHKKRFPIPWKLTAAVIAGVLLILWAGYRFYYGPILIRSLLTSHGVQRLAVMPPWKQKFLLFPYIPMNDLFRGLTEAYINGVTGRTSYLMGKTYTGGRLLFFPIAIATKTPIPLLILFVAGIAWMFRPGGLKKDSKYVVLIAGILGPLLVAMSSSINIGLRHVLPIYPFMAMLGAVAFMHFWRLKAKRGFVISVRVALVLLLSWNIIGCLRASPDFMAYFNEPSAPYGSYLLLSGDLDWGQDLKRLGTRLDELHVQNLWMEYFGRADLNKRLHQSFEILSPTDRPAGWIAISEYKYREQPGDFGWLALYPYEEIGHSIRLYHILNPPGVDADGAR